VKCDLRRHAPHYQAVEAAPAVRAKNNHVRAPLLGFFHDDPSWIVLREWSFRAQLRIELSQYLGAGINSVLCLLLSVEVFDLLQFEIRKHANGNERFRNREHFTAFWPRATSHGVQCYARVFRAVGRDKNLHSSCQ